MLPAVSCSAEPLLQFGLMALILVPENSFILQDAPKLKAAIVGSGLAGLSTAVELLDQGYEVDIYESRPFIGGKVASWQKDGNHVEMGLHVVSDLMRCFSHMSIWAVHVQHTATCSILLPLHRCVHMQRNAPLQSWRWSCSAYRHALHSRQVVNEN